MTRAPHSAFSRWALALKALAAAALVVLTGCPASECKGDLSITFSPMHSAFDGVHAFQLPAFVPGLDVTTDGGVPKWSLADPTLADVKDDGMGGVMLTMRKAGTTSVEVRVGPKCGASTLVVSAATASSWTAGEARYKNGQPYLRDGGLYPDGGAEDTAVNPLASCDACHSEGAVGPFRGVAHTPEQTGGYGDDELVRTYTAAQIPDGGYFDTNLISYQSWQRFHHWAVTQDEAQGLLVYLRSLPPQAQSGTNYGGHFLNRAPTR